MTDIIFTANVLGQKYSKDFSINSYIDRLTADIIKNIRLSAQTMGPFRLEISSNNVYEKEENGIIRFIDVEVKLPLSTITDLNPQRVEEILKVQLHLLVSKIFEDPKMAGTGWKYTKNFSPNQVYYQCRRS